MFEFYKFKLKKENSEIILKFFKQFFWYSKQRRTKNDHFKGL